MNYSRHIKAQLEREALLKAQPELNELEGEVRAKAEEKVIAEATEEAEVVAEEPKKRGRKPKAE